MEECRAETAALFCTTNSLYALSIWQTYHFLFSAVVSNPEILKIFNVRLIHSSSRLHVD